jgi:DNA replication and repair protein RecF
MEGLRGIGRAELEFSPGWNVFSGRNGVGKTTCLEAIHLLHAGKGLRAGRNVDLIQWGGESALIRGRISGEGGVETVVVVKSREGTVIRVDGRPVHAASDLARRLPLVLIGQEGLELLYGGPEGRRRYLDRIMFHVEQQEFLAAWQAYQLILKHRNALLQQAAPDKELLHWDSELVAMGESLHGFRVAALSRLVEALKGLKQTLDFLEIQVGYDPGWRGGTLSEAIQSARRVDRGQRYTHVGPHRGDLVIEMDGHLVKAVLSRGEIKRLTVALLLAQREICQGQGGALPLLLLDDLAAELDCEAFAAVMSVVAGQGGQIVMTSTRFVGEEGIAYPQGARMFHVEHGTVRAMP